ncbi:glycosyltransferase involved in cell wall bisynthesis [Jatrophihabitans sp. GAS493]|uniref:glycosyltransferase family 4 protein n=1 Tax=Jatrophihabitans sp. GAS493 TaxID=1907575 RepID=UPI000BB8AC72|nr:glycosyltransferase family 4 protein [Jatrophihabitans sp. GAS493]SOD70307.1 glycosyltransferase involved in cell wall bisynthesis [Jatrophihabitans sp. GAS493]
MTLRSQARQLWRRLLDWAQHHGHRLPAPLRKWLAGRFLAGEAMTVEDWSQPLISAPADGTGRPTRRPAEPPPGLPPPSTGRGAARSEHPDTGSAAALRCLLVTESLDVGGMDEVVAFLARRLPEVGIATAVLHAPLDHSQPLGRLGQALLAEGISVFDHPRTDGAAELRRWQPDVVSVHGGPDWTLAVAHESQIPVVETLHGMHSLFGARAADVSARAAMLSGIVSVSELVRQQYLEINPAFGGDRVITIPNGVDPGRVAMPDRAAARDWLGLTDEYVVTSLARHCLQKNTYGLVCAFDDIAARIPDAHLVLAGRPDDANYSARVKRLQTTMQHGDRVHLRDHASRPEVLLAASDAFVLDSFFEGWALASMEALVAGLPVVLADVGGAREQLAGPVAKGSLISNPLGDPLVVDWPSIRAARYRRQSNRGELVEGVTALSTDRDRWLAARAEIRAESIERFDPGVVVSRHAHVLAAAARRAPLSLPTELAV